MKKLFLVVPILIISIGIQAAAHSKDSEAKEAYQNFVKLGKIYEQEHGRFLNPPFYEQIVTSLKKNIARAVKHGKVTEQTANTALQEYAEKKPAELIRMYDDQKTGLALFIREDNIIKPVTITRKLGAGTNKVAYNIKGSDKGLVVFPPDPYSSKAMEQEIDWSNYATSIGLLNAQPQRVEVSTDKKKWFPAYIANSFEALAHKGTYVLNPKGHHWRPTDKNCLFKSMNDVYDINNWAPLIENDLIQDAAKWAYYGLPGGDAMSAAYQKKKDGSCAIRYFGFDFEGRFLPKQPRKTDFSKFFKDALFAFRNIISIAFPLERDYSTKNPWDDDNDKNNGGFMEAMKKIQEEQAAKADTSAAVKSPYRIIMDQLTNKYAKDIENALLNLQKEYDV